MITIPIELIHSQNRHMTIRKPLYQVGEAVLKQLHAEAMLQQQADDGLPNVPTLDPLSSA